MTEQSIIKQIVTYALKTADGEKQPEVQLNNQDLKQLLKELNELKGDAGASCQLMPLILDDRPGFMIFAGLNVINDPTKPSISDQLNGI